MTMRATWFHLPFSASFRGKYIIALGIDAVKRHIGVLKERHKKQELHWFGDVPQAPGCTRVSHSMVVIALE